MKQGRGDTHRGSRNSMHVMATIREESRANIESTEGVFIPRLAHERGNISVTQLTSRKDRMSTEVKRLADEAMVSRYGRVKVGWAGRRPRSELGRTGHFFTNPVT
jgi:hypothetical protein